MSTWSRSNNQDIGRVSVKCHVRWHVKVEADEQTCLYHSRVFRKTFDIFHTSAQVSHPCVRISRYGCGGSNIWGWRRSFIYFIDSGSRDLTQESGGTARGQTNLERFSSRVRARGSFPRNRYDFPWFLTVWMGDSSAPVLRHLHLPVRPPSHDADVAL